MTKEEAIKHLHTYSSTNGSGLTTQEQHEEAKKMAIKALEQPECEDAVSRADVDILIEEAQTAWLKGDILLMYPALKRGLQKLQSVTPKQPGWTYIEEALPATIINKHTNDYQEYNCLCDFGDYGFDVRTYKFGNGHFWNGGGIVDKYVTAWQPLPEIPDALKPKPWEGGQDG